MEGISGISGISGLGSSAKPISPITAENTPVTTQSTDVGNTVGNLAGDNVAVWSASDTNSLVAISSMSITATAESYVATNGPMLSSNELIGLVLLMLTLEYMESQDDQEKKGLLELMSLLAQQMSPENSSGGMFMYSSSSLSIESTQIVALSNESVINAYMGGSSNPQQVVPTDTSAGATGLNTIV